MELSSGQKGLLVFGGAFVAVGLVMTTVVFPFWNLIREDVYEEVVVLSNTDGVCYADTADDTPKTISGCEAAPGDTITIKFGRGLAWATVVDP
ncbi:conserved hypothetical protein [Nitrosopumilaceae archaeon]|nr:hypothetical protein [Nitrosopumilus sp.]CAI9831509.1 conserved hypothetical protein [Nitrosopumilaceae archaeon]MDA7944588.1 hypothetical protein [Nitrosopumilus sp.]MDA7953907.1 hypothetical protein [Nitrosopumilus sp.]MDA7973268.1 hypothetical protein [Nitrosopumilus sp.]